MRPIAFALALPGAFESTTLAGLLDTAAGFLEGKECLELVLLVLFLVLLIVLLLVLIVLGPVLVIAPSGLSS